VIQRVTPGAVFSLYRELSDDDKREFLKKLGATSTAEVLIPIGANLRKTEQARFSGAIHAKAVERVIPLIIRHARKILRELPDIDDEAFEKELEKGFAEWSEDAAREVSALEKERVKADRDRKSDPETVRRNVEICDLRKQNPRLWTQGKLAKRYAIKPQTVRGILKEEEKWRRLAAELSGN
jgi:hypothetical protein